MRTHVSYDGILQKATLVSVAPYGSSFVSFGRWVSPNGNYDNAPRVALYHLQGVGFYAVK